VTARDVPRLSDAIVAVIRGAAVNWTDVHDSPDALAVAAETHELGPLLYYRLRRVRECDWPVPLIERLGRAARAEAVVEATRRAELASSLEALARVDVHPVLIKGTALAYTVYDNASARPRCDTDVLVARDQVDRAREVLFALGYEPSVCCDGELVLRQFEMHKIDRLGVEHTLDVHWCVSTQTVFADMLSYDELFAGAIAVPPLGSFARAAGLTHALLLACVHPVMHHRNERRAIWMYDIHLLASLFSCANWQAFARLAIERKVAAVVASALRSARGVWGTSLPDGLVATLAAVADEPSAEYLAVTRTWRHEFVANVSHLPTWRDRLRLLREIAFPSPTYIFRAYQVDGSIRSAFLPAFYVHRLALGVGKVFLGRK
jgi:hypothetical protein